MKNMKRAIILLLACCLLLPACTAAETDTPKTESAGETVEIAELPTSTAVETTETQEPIPDAFDPAVPCKEKFAFPEEYDEALAARLCGDGHIWYVFTGRCIKCGETVEYGSDPGTSNYPFDSPNAGAEYVDGAIRAYAVGIWNYWDDKDNAVYIPAALEGSALEVFKELYGITDDLPDYSISYKFNPGIRFRENEGTLILEEGVNIESLTSVIGCSRYVFEGHGDVYLPLVRPHHDMSRFVINSDATVHFRAGGLMNWGFEECTLPPGTAEVTKGLFSSCRNLKSVTLPASVTTIGSSVFSNCKELRDVNIPATVISIDADLFYRCDSLPEVYYGGTVEQWKAYGVKGDFTVHCSDGDFQNAAPAP